MLSSVLGTTNETVGSVAYCVWRLEKDLKALNVRLTAALVTPGPASVNIAIGL